MGKGFSSFHTAQIRIARPTGQFDEIIRFYERGTVFETNRRIFKA